MRRSEYFMNSCCKNYDSVIPRMVKKAHDIAEKSVDYECKNFGHIDFRLDEKGNVSFKFGRSRENFQMSSYAYYQLCHKIGMPYQYYKKLIANPELRELAYNSINTLSKHCKENLVLRTCDKYLRGIVTTKYCPFDSEDLLDVFHKAFTVSKILPMDEVQIRGHYLDMDFFHLRFTESESIKGLSDKDLYFGMQLSSSDVGRSSIRLSFYVYKKICTNGLCISKFDQQLYCQRHIGVTKDQVYKGLMDAFANYPYLVVQAKGLLLDAGKKSLVGSKLLMVHNLVEADKQVEAMQKYLGISHADMAKLADITQTKYEPSVWGYVNAITEYAQDFEVTRRIELESRAGALLSNSDLFDVA